MATDWVRRRELLVESTLAFGHEFLASVREAYANPDPRWREDDLPCRGRTDLEWAQPEGLRSKLDREAWLEGLRAVCAGCPQPAQCAAEEYQFDDWNAINAVKSSGSVRGGMTPGQRMVSMEYVTGVSEVVA